MEGWRAVEAGIAELIPSEHQGQLGNRAGRTADDPAALPTGKKNGTNPCGVRAVAAYAAMCSSSSTGRNSAGTSKTVTLLARVPGPRRWVLS